MPEEVFFLAVVVFFAVEDLLEEVLFFAVEDLLEAAVLLVEVDFFAVEVLVVVFAMIIPPFGMRGFFVPYYITEEASRLSNLNMIFLCIRGKMVKMSHSSNIYAKGILE